MKKDSGSATAIGVAMLRAVHQLLDGEEKLLDDPISLKLVPEEWKTYALQNRFRYFDPVSMALRTHVVLRSRYAEDCLAEAYQRGVKQYLMLGAGLDTFAYRQPEWAKNLNIVEADHPASQADKFTSLQESQIAIPKNVSFVAVDLEKDDLNKIFAQSTLNLEAPIFISCLGVLVYLSEGSIARIFSFLRQFSPQSEFVFTISTGKDIEKLNITAEKAAEVGEPWITHFNQEELQKQLTKAGFKEVIFETPDSIISKYYEGSKLQLPAPKRNTLVRVII